MSSPLVWLNPASFLVLLSVGLLVGRRIGKRSRETPLSPPPQAFSIWSLIYSLLAVFCVAQAYRDDLRSSVGIWFVLFCAFASAWTVAFTLPLPSSLLNKEEDLVVDLSTLSPVSDLVWSVLPFLLISSATASSFLSLLSISPPFGDAKVNPSDWEVLVSRSAFSLLSGWLSAATCLSFLGMVDETTGLKGIPPTLVSVSGWSLLLVVASGIQPLLGWNPVFVLPLVWASFSRAAAKSDKIALVAGIAFSLLFLGTTVGAGLSPNSR